MSCTRFQLRAALLRAGLLEVANATRALKDGVAALAWEHADVWRPSSITLQAIAKELGMTEDQLDDLFTDAVGLQP